MNNRPRGTDRPRIFTDRPKLFLDTTVLVALSLSTREHPPGRYFFEMAIHGLIDLVVSRNVTDELEGILRQIVPEKAPRLLAMVAENLVLSHATHAAEPNEDTMALCIGMTDYRPDAKIVAAAIETACEVLVSTDKQHLLGNSKIGPPQTTLVVMSTAEALQWCQEQISIRSRHQR